MSSSNKDHIENPPRQPSPAPWPEGIASSSAHSGREPIVLVAGADDKYAIGLTVALSSALSHLDPDRHAFVYVLDGGLSSESRTKCHASLSAANKGARITFVNGDLSKFSRLNDQGYSRASFLRLLIPDVVSDEFGRVLYLDSDVVVLGDVSELWALPDEGWTFWAATDDGIDGARHSRDPVVYSGVPLDSPIFNSGVMLIELPRWRETAISERALQLLSAHSNCCITPDQDALNAIAWSEWGKLSSEWNCQVRGKRVLSKIDTGEDGPKIIHYLDAKPWDGRVACAYQDAFDTALFSSGWFTLASEMWYRARQATNRTKRRLRPQNLMRAAQRRIRWLAERLRLN